MSNSSEHIFSNSLWVNSFNTSFNLMYLSLLGFIALYLWLLIFTMCALLFVKLCVLYNISPYSSYTANEIDGLLFSNAL